MPKVSEVYMEARRQQILDVALACFARNGFHETTIEDICQEAQLSHGAVYRYFPSKEDIIEASSWRDREVRASRFAGAQQKGSAYHVLEEILCVYIRRLTHPEVESVMRLRVQLFGEALRNARIEATVCSTWDDVLQRFREIIQRAQEAGEVNPELDPHAVARVLLAIHDGLLLQKTIDKDVDVEKCEEALMALYSCNLWREQSKEA